MTEYRGAVSKNSPTYWWFGDQPSGNLRDSADSNPAVPSGAVDYNRTTMVVGEGTAVRNNGSGIFFTITTVNLTGDFTLEWWYQKEAAIGFNPFWSEATGDHPAVYWFTSVISVFDTNNVACAISDTSVNDADVHYIVVTRSGTTCTIFSDGTDITAVHNAWTGALDFDVRFINHMDGFGNASTVWQHGAIYVGTVLSGTDITNHYNAGT